MGGTNNLVRGIFRYMSPEYMESGEANTPTDVYGFVVMVLEVLLVKRIREFEATGRSLEVLADPRLDREYKHQ
ncbi:Receptor like protein kinase S.2 [Bienertia sinuspersici]